MKKGILRHACAVFSVAVVIGLLSQAFRSQAAELPGAFDLRERGVVTSVKSQDPFNSCWAFGGTAAAEISILSELKMTTSEYRARYKKPFDLSERHLAWWAYHSQPDGEGVHLFGETKVSGRNLAFDIGGIPYIADEMFAVGSGPVYESYAPYVGRSGSGKKSYGYGANWTLGDKTRYHFSYELMDGNRLPSPAVYKSNKNGNLATNKLG
ncbi:MAG: hypothetical protein IJ679_10905, partial [Lachnospiraceae bacterium]|nr:hypothetical protein [Lachnospiraceae bacterium]